MTSDEIRKRFDANRLMESTGKGEGDVAALCVSFGIMLLAGVGEIAAQLSDLNEILMQTTGQVSARDRSRYFRTYL